MSEREALYGTKLRQNREDRVLRLLKNLVDFLSLSLSFDGDDPDKLILQLGRRASFTPLSIFCLRRRALLLLLLLLLLLCVLSFSLEDDDDDARAGSKKERVFSMAQNKEKERKKREKEGETR